MPAKKVEKEEVPTVDYKKMNVFQKLQTARVMFLNSGAKKTGKNFSLEFTYFELSDIVPVAEKIFAEVGLLMVPNFGKEYASAYVYNTDDREEPAVVFSAPFTIIAPIVSNSGKAVTNEMQALGSSITYMRRYLWQLVLDIIELDSIDNLPGEVSDTPTPAPAPNVPVSEGERQKIKEELTAAPTDAASAERVDALRGLLKNLLDVDPEQESFVQSIAVKTEAFTKITSDACEQLIVGVTEILKNYEG